MTLTFEHFHIEAVLSPAIPGYLIVRPHPAVHSLSELSEEALAAFGPLLAAGMAAIQKAVQPERIYVIRLGEEVEAIHFHLFPRSLAMMDLYTMHNPGQPKPSGAYLFDWIRKPDIAAQLRADETTRRAAELIHKLLS